MREMASTKDLNDTNTEHPRHDDRSPRSISRSRDLWSAFTRLKSHGKANPRTATLVCLGIISFVLLLNIVTAAWALHHVGLGNGLVVIYHGSCKKMRNINRWVHLCINLLASLLLGASNYVMQRLSAPTRKDVDNAHQKHVWLEIGVNSARNLLHIPWTRKTLYLVLLAFSLPIHFVYNSVLVAVGANNEGGFQAAIVTPDFLHGAPAPGNMGSAYASTYQALQAELPQMQRLENAACIQAYGQASISDWGDLLLVTDGDVPSDLNDSLVDFINSGLLPVVVPWAWMCGYDDYGPTPPPGFQCDIKHLLANPAAWSLHNCSINYCLAQRTPEDCELDFSFHLILVVIICNLVKLIAVGIAMFSLNPPSLNTIGDAIASFLAVPDSYTENMCLVSKADFQHCHFLSRWISPVHPRPWFPRRHFLWRIVDGPLLLVCNAM